MKLERIMGIDVTGIHTDESGVIYCPTARELHSKYKYNLLDLNDSLYNLLLVLRFFRENQPEKGYIRKWETPALSRFIRKYIFNDRISSDTAKKLAVAVIEISIMSSGLF